MKRIQIIWHVGADGWTHRYGGCSIMEYQGKKPTNKQIKEYLVSINRYLEGLEITIDHVDVLK